MIRNMLGLNIFANVILCLVLISRAQETNEIGENSNSEDDARDHFFGLLPQIIASTTGPSATSSSTTEKEDTTNATVTSTHQMDTILNSTVTTMAKMNTTKSVSMTLNETTPSPSTDFVPVGERLTDECDKLPTPRLTASCKNIAQNTVWATMEFVEFDVNDFVGDGGRTLSFGLPLTCEVTCPKGKEWTEASGIHERSFSPWTYCTEYDPHRLPQWLSYAKCKCKGCMDPSTAEENSNFVSMPLITTIPVLTKDDDVATFADCTDKKCTESTYQITLGCHCVFPDLAQGK